MQSQMDLLLLQLAESLNAKTRKGPRISQQLRGIVHAPEGFDYKEELAKRFDA